MLKKLHPEILEALMDLPPLETFYAEDLRYLADAVVRLRERHWLTHSQLRDYRMLMQRLDNPQVDIAELMRLEIATYKRWHALVLFHEVLETLAASEVTLEEK